MLVVDDSVSELQLLDHILFSWGVQATLCTSAEEAMHRLREQRYDYLITDWRMPDTDGVDLIARAQRELGESCPRMVMVTAFDKEHLLVEAASKQVHIDCILTKPFTSSSLFDTLARRETMMQRTKPTDLQQFEGHVLLVEDNAINREVALGYLADHGVTVSIAEDGQQAVEMTRAQHFDLIFMDLQMPVMDGYEATRQIRQTDTSIPIIALSAAVMSRDQEQTKEAGMNDHLAKPIDTAALRAILSTYLAPKTGEIARTPVITAGSYTAGRRVGEPVLNERAIDFNKLMGLAHTSERAWHLLHNFSDEFGNADAQLALEHEDSEAFRRLVHTLKGVGGNLCMPTLYATAIQVEEADGADARGGALQALRQALQEVLLEIAQYEITQAPAVTPQSLRAPASAVVGNGQPEYDEAVAALCENLRRKRPKACNVALQRLEQLTLSAIDQERFARVRQALEAYDFKQAAILLEHCNER